MYSPLWKIPHRKPSVSSTPPFEKSPIKAHWFCVLPPLKNHCFWWALIPEWAFISVNTVYLFEGSFRGYSAAQVPGQETPHSRMRVTNQSNECQAGHLPRSAFSTEWKWSTGQTEKKIRAILLFTPITFIQQALSLIPAQLLSSPGTPCSTRLHRCLLEEKIYLYIAWRGEVWARDGLTSLSRVFLARPVLIFNFYRAPNGWVF